MTQIDLATAAGLSVSYLTRLEAGGANPRVATLGKLAVALGIEPTSLFVERNGEAVGGRTPL
jgi:transcriptional regulator with XRE-family HTH domain